MDSKDLEIVVKYLMEVVENLNDKNLSRGLLWDEQILFKKGVEVLEMLSEKLPVAQEQLNSGLFSGILTKSNKMDVN